MQSLDSSIPLKMNDYEPDPNVSWISLTEDIAHRINPSDQAQGRKQLREILQTVEYWFVKKVQLVELMSSVSVAAFLLSGTGALISAALDNGVAWIFTLAAVSSAGLAMYIYKFWHRLFERAQNLNVLPFPFLKADLNTIMEYFNDFEESERLALDKKDVEVSADIFKTALATLLLINNPILSKIQKTLAGDVTLPLKTSQIEVFETKRSDDMAPPDQSATEPDLTETGHKSLTTVDLDKIDAGSKKSEVDNIPAAFDQSKDIHWLGAMSPDTFAILLPQYLKTEPKNKRVMYSKLLSAAFNRFQKHKVEPVAEATRHILEALVADPNWIALENRPGNDTVERIIGREGRSKYSKVRKFFKNAEPHKPGIQLLFGNLDL